MNGVIETILEAEERAEQIVRAAADESKRMAAESQAEAEQIKAEAKAAFVKEREKVLAETREKAEEAYSRIVKDGRKKAQELKDSVGAKIEDSADTILRRMFG